MNSRQTLLTLGFTALTTVPAMAHREPMVLRDVLAGQHRYVELAVNQAAEGDFLFLVAGLERTDIDFGSFHLQVRPDLIVPLGSASGGPFRIELPIEFPFRFIVQGLKLNVSEWTISATSAIEIQGEIGHGDGSDQDQTERPEPPHVDMRQTNPAPILNDTRPPIERPQPANPDMQKADPAPIYDGTQQDEKPQPADPDMKKADPMPIDDDMRSVGTQPPDNTKEPIT